MLIEKLSVVPLGAVLLKEPVKNILSNEAEVEHDRGLLRKLVVDLLVQDWVAVVMIGVNEELATSTQLGNTT